MLTVRRLIAQRYLAALICAAALLLRLVVPTGYMLDSGSNGVTVTICSGMAPSTMTMTMPGMKADPVGHGKSRDHGKAEMPCAFAGLSIASLAAIDTAQLVLLIAFLMAGGLAACVAPSLNQRPHQRPPLRGPPDLS